MKHFIKRRTESTERFIWNIKSNKSEFCLKHKHNKYFFSKNSKNKREIYVECKNFKDLLGVRTLYALMYSILYCQQA